VNNCFGPVTARNIQGYLTVTGRPTGEDVFVRNTFGEVSLEQISGGVEIGNSNGSIEILKLIKEAE
jgi:hypothetical protein